MRGNVALAADRRAVKFTITPLGVLALRVWLEGEEKGEDMAHTEEWHQALDKAEVLAEAVLACPTVNSNVAKRLARLVMEIAESVGFKEAQRQRQAVKDSLRGMEEE